MNNLFYTTGSKEDEFICISNLDEEGVEHLVCSEGAQAASSKIIFYKFQLGDILGLIPQLGVRVHSFYFEDVKFMPKS